MSQGKLAGRVAIVTGGARGIGRAIAEDLMLHGAKVVIVDSGVTIGGEPVEPKIAEEVGAHSADSVGLAGDIADVAQQAVELAIERFGGVDIIVNNAAIIRDGFIFKADIDAFDAVIRTNLTGTYRLMAAATPAMRDQVKAGRAPGTIINLVSTAAFYGNFGQSAYAAAKAGMYALTRVAAHDMGRSGVTCNAVIPFAATRVTESIKPANDQQAAYKESAMQVPAVYVARFVSFLSTPEAKSISGQLFGVRGREVMLYSQPRPVTKVLQPQGGYELEAFAAGIRALEPHYSDLVTDLEAFSSDPVL